MKPQSQQAHKGNSQHLALFLLVEQIKKQNFRPKMKSNMSKQSMQRLLHLVHPLALLPLALLLWDMFLGAGLVNPIQEATLRTGLSALVLLLLSLACTPVNLLLRWKWVMSLRRPLGLYAFLYASLHLLIFAVIDYGLDWSLMLPDIADKRYVVVGFAAFMLLLPLAITSTKGWQRRLGKHWKALHRLVYAAAALAILHFVWLVKSDIRLPLAYAAILIVLLIVRLPASKKLINSRRKR